MESRGDLCPKVSIVIPVKNGADQIKDLLDSLLKIDYDENKLEIIVVDGKSTDATREIAQRYPVKIVTEENPGINGARNTGVKLSSGEIIAFTDYDCVVPINWVKSIVREFHDPSVGCVGGSVSRYLENFLSRYADESLIPVMRMFRRRIAIDRIHLPFSYPMGCNFAVRKAAIEKAGLFDERFTCGFDELEFVERICKKGYKLVLTPDVIVRHKHRQSLLGLLEQTFRYGKGGGVLLRVKGIKSIFGKWVFLSLIGFLAWILSGLAFTLYTVFSGNGLSLAALLFLAFTPPLILLLTYLTRSTKADGRRRWLLAYPLLDILRFLAFASGILVGLFKYADKR
ncbi:MAG: glycosyltransferase [Candidatus Bathyarchaeota archaeon]|nr:glycosyltransferase [Candidatus Bathyarchaeota archaeon]